MDVDNKLRVAKIKNDCPVICKYRTSLPYITITGNENLDKVIIKKHGSIELYLFHKVIDQFDEIAAYKRQILVLKRKLRAANAVIDVYRENL